MDTATVYGPDTLFKTLNGRYAANGGKHRYRRDRWTRGINPVVPCRTGWHLARGAQVLNWLSPTLWIAEYDPTWPVVEQFDKLVAGRVRIVEKVERWDKRTARLFAADCAEAALLGERATGREPNDRSWEAIEVARRFADGNASASERAAARAARDAARAATEDAARAARDAARAAREAAYDAARAAYAAAYHATLDAWDAGAATKDAARATARAAEEAAKEAGSAAREAGAAAWDAGAAAGDAARDALYARLCAYLNGQPLPPAEPLY